MKLMSAVQRTMLLIDGSLLEGGAITGTPISVDKVRQGRSKPGLRPQHLTGLQLVERISGGVLEGGEVGSCNISFSPGKLQGGQYEADTRTAGSCTLMVQQSLPCLLYTASQGPQPTCSQVTLKGGTDADMAPPIDYLVHVLTPTLKRLLRLTELQVELKRRGFMPRGGGTIHVSCPALAPGRSLQAFAITDRGEVSKVTIRTYSAGRVPDHVARKLANTARALLTQLVSLPEGCVEVVVVRETDETACDNGMGISVVAETTTGCLFGACAPSQRGVAVESVASNVVGEMVEALECGACVDQWMQDQLIVFMGLAQGESRMLCGELTLHTRTAIEIVGTLLPDAQFQVSSVQEGGKQLWLVTCKGAGLVGR